MGQLDIYQSYQEDADFHNCEYLVSFLGTEKSRAVFIGVYKVLSIRPASDVPLPREFHHYDIFKPSRNYYYELKKIDQFEELKDRLVIAWGGATIKWDQWFPKDDKEVIEILPKGYVRHFPGYLDFILPFDELKTIIEHPDSHHDWHQMLKAVSGVYLIVDDHTGKQYIGSASGEEGILGRFKSYAKTIHGGNVELKKLLKDNPESARNLNFTLLETLPLSLTPNEVLKREELYKKKLGSRKHGYNLN